MCYVNLQPWRREGMSVLTLVAFVGCSATKSNAKPEDLVQVQGVVTADRKPLAKAIVTFIPIAEDSTPARGVTNDRGQYKLLGKSGSPGIPPGDYKVAIRAMSRDTKSFGRNEDGRDEDSQPYANPKTTPLRATVKTGDKSHDFKLEAPRKSTEQKE